MISSAVLRSASGISFKMTQNSRSFYLFLGLHSFLLGLLPFFLPVYFFKNGADISTISWFIAITGFGYSCSLWLWERFRSATFLGSIVLSFVLECFLVFLILGEAPWWLIALVNGPYSCLFWTIQRLLFFEGGTTGDSGRRFGNFQIYVMIVLKVGILVGSLLLECSGMMAIFLLTVAVACVGISVFVRPGQQMFFPATLQQQKTLSLKFITSFRDKYHSRSVFMIDGIFLYLESYFWLISLFLVVGESFVRLGVLVIVLAVALAVLFLIIKNRIDRVDPQKMYICGVILYMLSWFMRGTLSVEMGPGLQISLLLIIAFCTSFFRLAFNKRFFDTAKKGLQYRYILIKSYYSQTGLALFFALFGWWALHVEDLAILFRSIYWGAGLFACVFFVYRAVEAIEIEGHE